MCVERAVGGERQRHVCRQHRQVCHRRCMFPQAHEPLGAHICVPYNHCAVGQARRKHDLGVSRAKAGRKILGVCEVRESWPSA